MNVKTVDVEGSSSTEASCLEGPAIDGGEPYEFVRFLEAPHKDPLLQLLRFCPIAAEKLCGDVRSN